MKHIFVLFTSLLLKICVPSIEDTSWVQPAERTSLGIESKINIKNIFPVALPTIIDSTLIIISEKNISFINTNTNKIFKSIESEKSIEFPQSKIRINNNILFFSDYNNTLFAYDTNTGNLKWSSNKVGALFQYLFFDEKNVFIATDKGLLTINQEKGDVLWTKELIIYNYINLDTTMIISSENTIYSIFKETGKIQWKTGTLSNRIFDIIYFKKSIIYTTKKRLYSININNGIKEWDITLKKRTDTYEHSLLSNDKYVILSNNYLLYKLDIENKKISKLKGQKKHLKALLKDDLMILESTHGSGYYTYNLIEEKVQWEIKFNTFTPFEPSIINDFFYFQNDNKIIEVDINSGETINSYSYKSYDNSVNINDLIFFNIDNDTLSILKK